MADRLRIVTLRWPQPPAVLADFSPSGTGLARDSFAIKLGDPVPSLSVATNRWGGERTVAERRTNGSITFRMMSIGATPNAALALAQSLMSQVLSANNPNMALEWRPDGASYSEYWHLRGPATLAVPYRWVEFKSANYIPVDVTLPVAPTAVGAPYDIYDDFSTDSVTAGDWIHDGGNQSVSVLGGQLAPNTITDNGPLMRYRHARGYAYGDVEVALKITTGASVTNGIWEVTLGADTAGADTYLAMGLSSTGYSLYKRVAGTLSTLSGPTALSPAANTTYYLLLRRAGNVLYWRVGTSQNWADYTVEPNTYVLTGADLRLAGTGHVGFAIAPAATTERYGPFSARPFTYRGIKSPEQVQLLGQIVGEAPALADIEVTPVVGASTNPAMFGLVAWGERPQVPNIFTPGNFSTIRSNGSATYGWQVAAVTGVQAAAGTSYARGLGTNQKYAASNLQIVMPATAGSGANALVTRRFKRGRIYAAYVWLGNDTTGGTRSCNVKLGVSGDVATSPFIATTPAFKLTCAVWQPTADYDAAFLSIQQSTAVAGTTEAAVVAIVEVPTMTLGASMTATQTTAVPWYTSTDIPNRNPDGTISQPFLILVDLEIMRVTQTGATWTVDRAQEGTVASTHNTDAFVIVLPPARPQYEGKGALPIFGIHEGEYFALDRLVPTLGSSTDYRAGGYAGYSGAGNLEFYVDPSSVPPDDFSQGDVLVEVWARLAFDPAGTGMTITTSCAPSEQYDPTALSSLAGVRRYTYEYGSAGMAIRAPSGTGGTLYPQWFKLGTLPMVSDRARPQRWRIQLAYGQSSGAGWRCDYLATMPIRNRAATPTGKSSADITYPGFVPIVVSANAITKTLRSDGSGLIRVPRLGVQTQPDAYPDAGLGHVIDLPNTDTDLMVKLSNLVPNDPGAQGMEMFTAEPFWTVALHVAVTPRFAAVRGA